MPKIALVCEREDCKDLEEVNKVLNCIFNQNHYELTIDYEEADLVLIWIAGYGMQKVLDIQALADILYNKKEDAKVMVTGELGSRKFLLQKNLPEVEAKTVEEVCLLLGGMPSEKKRYIKQNTVVISEGCKHNCSYCIYPLIDNVYKSKKIEQILEEVDNMYEEELLIYITGALETGDYGMDVYGERKLPELLDAICTKYPNCEYHIMRLHPDGITDELIQILKKHANKIAYVEVSIEHVDDGILSKMGRPNWESTFLKLQILHKQVPTVDIGTSVIVGFPGESELSFRRLSNAMKSNRFANIEIHDYERVHNTKAASFLERTSPEIMMQRRQEIVNNREEETGIVMYPYFEETQYPLSSIYEDACIELNDWYANIYTAVARQNHDYIAGTDAKMKLADQWISLAEEFAERILLTRENGIVESTKMIMQGTFSLEFRNLIWEIIEEVEGKPKLQEKAKYILLE